MSLPEVLHCGLNWLGITDVWSPGQVFGHRVHSQVVGHLVEPVFVVDDVLVVSVMAWLVAHCFLVPFFLVPACFETRFSPERRMKMRN